MSRYCYIHIGMHKTGTTSIQAFLAANRVQLAARSLFIPLSGGNGEPEFACHHGIVRALLGQGRSDGDRAALDAIVADLRESDAEGSCLSSEDFALLYDRPDLLMRLRDAIRESGFEPRIVVYARPQASYAVAIYAANVDSGFDVPFRMFLNDVCERGCYLWDGGSGPPFDYARLLDPFASVFGRDAIELRRFRSDAPDTELLASFLQVVVPHQSSLANLVVPVRRANRTLTFAGVLRRLGVHETIDEHVRFAPLTPLLLAHIWLRFRTSNRDLAARYGTKVPTFEALDLMRALPIRKSVAKTRHLIDARHALFAFSGPRATDGNAAEFGDTNRARKR